jgi:hypothetical protein
MGTRDLRMEAVVTKAWDGPHGSVRFEHAVL